MKTTARLAALGCLFLCLLVAPQRLAAQGIPQLLNYQGRIVAGGTNFNGTGQFKFALVNGDGTQTFWSNDNTSSGGSEPAAGVTLPVANGLYSVLLGDTALGAAMTAIPAEVFSTNADVRLRVWFNDGSHGWQLLTPDQRIAAVGYAVIAGNVPDGAITGAKLAAGAVTASSIADGAITNSQLAAGAAAANLNASGQSGVGSGGVVLSTSPDATELVNAGYVKLTGIESAERFRALHRSPPGDRYSHSAVWTGSEMIVWGGVTASVVYLGDGARYNPAFDLWTPLATRNAPTARASHIGVSVLGIMIIWGGVDGATYYADGGYYDPASDEWTPIPVSGLMSARAYHTAVVSSANEVIIWGGLGSSGPPTSTGGRLFFNQWRGATSMMNAPAGRYVHRAVWTGTEMIVWGGAESGSVFRNDGGHYNPTTDSWSPTGASPLATRYAHTMVWTGSRVLIWGGLGAAYYNDGASYDPGPKTWSLLNNTPGLTPTPRFYSTAVWTGSDMIAFGGQGSSNTPLGDGASYDPATNAWTPLPGTSSPTPRYVHTAVWTGTEMLVWGGYGRYPGNTVGTLRDGGRYSPAAGAWRSLAGLRGSAAAVWTGAELLIWAGTFGNAIYSDGLRLDMATNTWRAIAPYPAVTPSYGQSAVWTGTEMIVWGGIQQLDTPAYSTTFLNTGGRYNPAADSWTLTDAGSTAPSARTSHTAVWTGSEMLVWGGYGTGSLALNDGGRYDPANDTWTAMPIDPAVTARLSHSAVWTGSEMLIWGGLDASGPIGTGARFEPAGGTWTLMSTAGAPLPRYAPSAVWTGSELIIWGGQVTNATFDYVNSGGRYNPAADTWTELPPTPFVSPRGSHGAVWTGSEMIVWGGRSTNGGNYLADGGRFDPAAAGGQGRWSAIAPNTTVGGRSSSISAFWTGSEALFVTPYAAERNSFADVFSYTPPKTLYLYLRP